MLKDSTIYSNLGCCFLVTKCNWHSSSLMLSITTAVNFTIVGCHHRSPQPQHKSPFNDATPRTKFLVSILAPIVFSLFDVVDFFGCAAFNHSIRSNLTCINKEKRQNLEGLYRGSLYRALVLMIATMSKGLLDWDLGHNRLEFLIVILLSFL